MSLRARLGLGSAVRPVPERAPGGGASSFHLWWQGLGGGSPIVAASVTLEVLQAPVVAELWFWALQATFHDGVRSAGVAHLGLQWNSRHPGSTAVNFGGYRDSADTESVLGGSPSALPSGPDDPNTRDFAWVEGSAYELRISRGSVGWVGAVRSPSDGTEHVVRELFVGGDRLVDLVVWTEMFAGCRAPETIVRWSAPTVVRADGTTSRPITVTPSFPPDGCPNTDVRSTDDGLYQFTGRARTTREWAVLPVPPTR